MNNVVKKLSSLDFKHESNSRNYNLIRELAEVGFKKLGEGRNRITFLSPNGRYVLKFPLHEYGIDDNRLEASIYSRFKRNKKKYIEDFSPCRLINDTVLMMRAVVEDYGFGNIWDIEDYEHKFPDWVWEYDCNQCGLLSDGRLVVYDYAE